MNKYEEAFMKCAEVFAQTSVADRLKVGCFFVKDGNPLACGVNGTPEGWPTNVCEDENNKTHDYVIHAENNAVLKAAKAGISLDGATAYVTHSPCVKCSAMLKAVGIKRVVYKEVYRDTLGLEYLISKGVSVEKFNQTEGIL